MPPVAVSASPETVGPTWQRSADGWHLPEHTLGWQVINWASDTLLQPDGPKAGDPWDWTNEQMRFLLWWYAVDGTGRFSYRRAVLRRLKGWGKDPFAAALSAVEFLGPCRFAGWDAGEPVAMAHPAPWVQIAAVSRDQTRNTMTLFPGLFGGKDRARSLGVDLGKELIYGPGSARIEAVTSSPRALEGGRPSLVIANETHHWLPNNDGREMARAIARNLAKSRDGSARVLAITNAHEPGEDSVAEADWDAWQLIAAGKSRASGFLYDSLEAPAGTQLGDRDSLHDGLVAARGDSDWLDVDRLIEEILDPTTSPSMARRFYLNQIVAPEDAYLAPHQWAACATTERIERGDSVVAFFDGSSTDDHTALVLCRMSDGLVDVLGHWAPPDGGEIDRTEVDGAVARMFDDYKVQAFYADLAGWESYVDRWRDDFGRKLPVPATRGRKAHPIAWDMRGRVAEFSAAVERFEADVIAGELRHTGHPALAAHIANAKRAGNRWGFSIRKEHRESARKIDLAVCAVGARMARRDVQSAGKGTRTGRVVGF
jgi:phage terminase large subunit-like protein